MCVKKDALFAGTCFCIIRRQWVESIEMNRAVDGHLGWATRLWMKRKWWGFVEGVYSDVTILLRQHRHLHFFYSPPMTSFLFKRKTILE
jgi:hypothetical protein